jgi:hypothetical protein
MNKPYVNQGYYAGRTAFTASVVLARTLQKLFLAGLALAIGALLAPTALAQPIAQGNIRSAQYRITVPPNYTGTVIITNAVELADLYTNTPAYFNVSGPLPTGCTTNLWNSESNNLYSSGQTTNLWLALNLSSVAAGSYPFKLNLGNFPGNSTNSVTNHYNFTLEVAKIWNGSTNATRDGAGNWDTAGNWSDAVPGASDIVVFRDEGGQSNLFVITTASNRLVNCTISDNKEVSSLRFAQTNGISRAHTLQIAAGKTLSITGTGGLSIWRDYVGEYNGFNADADVAFVGASATVLVSNKDANVSLLLGNQTIARLDMSQLGTFAARVKQIGFGDWSVWADNFFNLKTNGLNAPSRLLTSSILAATNLFEANFKDSNNYNNCQDRRYGFCVHSSCTGATTAQHDMWLGVTNAWFMDGVCFAGSMERVNMAFWEGYLTNALGSNVTCYAYFRGTNQSSSANTNRMSMFAVGDAAAPGWNSGNQKAVIDFRRGTIDLLVDRLYVARDRDLLTYNSQPNFQGYLFFGSGTVDANEMVLGYQQYDHQTNVNGGDGEIRGYCQGYLIVSNGTVKVNSNLTVGYTSFATDNIVDVTHYNYGRIWVGDSATLMANNIIVDGFTNVSVGNWIVVSNRGNLVISNTLGSTTKRLDSLGLVDGTVTLHIDGAKTTPYLYVTNTTTGGSSNALVIAQVNGFDTNNTHLPIFSYKVPSSTLGASFTKIIMPSPYRGIPWDDGAGQWGLNLTTNPPNYLLWKGTVSANWDATTANWKPVGGGAATTFTPGDNVAFDDTATTFNINLVNPPLLSSLDPGGVFMTNNLNKYKFTSSSSGKVKGDPQWIKRGTNEVEISAETSASMQVQQGLLTGNGSGVIGNANISSGATMAYGGSIKSGLSSAGVATLLYGGSLLGTVTVNAGGIITNLGTMTASVLSMAAGSTPATPTLLVNSNQNLGILTFSGHFTVPTNALFINAGVLTVPTTGTSQNDDMTVANGGTFRDDGQGDITVYRLTIASGGTFIPGGSGIGITTVKGNDLGTSSGRVVFSAGSTNIFKVNPAVTGAGRNTILYSYNGFQDFGASQGNPAYNGGTILIDNLGGGYTNGQSFRMFGDSISLDQNIEATGSATNAYPIMRPDPAWTNTLTWDLSNLRYLDAANHNGIIRVKTIATNSVPLTYSASIYYDAGTIITNIVGNQTNYTTNDLLVSVVEWAADHTGWKLEEQANGVAVGLRNYDTNWTEVFKARWTNLVVLTNNFTTNSGTHFYRMRSVQPVTPP